MLEKNELLSLKNSQTSNRQPSEWTKKSLFQTFLQVDEEASPVKMKNTTCCVCNFNVFFLRFQRVVFAISTCCVFRLDSTPLWKAWKRRPPTSWKPPCYNSMSLWLNHRIRWDCSFANSRNHDTSPRYHTELSNQVPRELWWDRNSRWQYRLDDVAW